MKLGYRLQVIAVSIVLLVLSATYYLQPPTSQAHFVKSEGSVGVLLHLEPNDDPAAGEPSNIILEFKDINNNFRLSDCQCKLSIIENDKEISNLDLAAVSDKEQLTSIIPFNFPKKDIYHLKISGSPKNEEDADFSDFEITYDVRVAKSVNQASSQSKTPSWVSEHLIHLLGAGVVAVFLIAALIIQKKKEA